MSRLLDGVDEDPGHPRRARFDALVAEFTAKLKTDPAFRLKGEENREKIGKFISDQLRSWDQHYLAQQPELNIGTDLQFIRINGTLIGGLVGAGRVAVDAMAGLGG